MMKICNEDGLGGKGKEEVDSFQVRMPAADVAPASASGLFWMDCSQKHFDGFRF